MTFWLDYSMNSILKSTVVCGWVGWNFITCIWRGIFVYMWTWWIEIINVKEYLVGKFRGHRLLICIVWLETVSVRILNYGSLALILGRERRNVKTLFNVYFYQHIHKKNTKIFFFFFFKYESTLTHEWDSRVEVYFFTTHEWDSRVNI